MKSYFDSNDGELCSTYEQLYQHFFTQFYIFILAPTFSDVFFVVHSLM